MTPLNTALSMGESLVREAEKKLRMVGINSLQVISQIPKTLDNNLTVTESFSNLNPLKSKEIDSQVR